MDKITAPLLHCVAMFILGQLGHLFLIKMPSLRARAGAANKKFLFLDWWNCDWNIIIGTQILGAMLIIGLNEVVAWKPEILSYIRWFFGFVGAFGSTVVMAKLSQYDKGLTGIMNIKSNISDVLTGGTTTVEETIKRGTIATNQDVTQSPIK